MSNDIEKDLDQISLKYENKSWTEYLKYHCELTGAKIVGESYRFSDAFNDVSFLGRKELTARLIESDIKKSKGKDKDKLNLYLFGCCYLPLANKFSKFASDYQYSWFASQGISWGTHFENGYYYTEAQNLHRIHYRLGEKYKSKAEIVRNRLNSRETKKESYRLEAILFEKENPLVIKDGLKEDWKKASWGSPKYRGELRDLGELWAKAGHLNKAAKYFYKAGPYEFSSAAITFEEIKDEKRAVFFWREVGKNPTGYSDGVGETAGDAWERAGDIPKAIESYKHAISIFYMQDGSIDLHGDEKPGKEAAHMVEEKVRKLKKKLKDGKENIRKKWNGRSY